jgi:predicted GNAT family acetyltransferase
VPDNIAERLRPSRSYGFYLDKEHFQPVTVPECRRVTEADQDLIQEMTGSSNYGCPEESLRDGTAFGVVVDGKLVSLASVVPTPEATSNYRLAWPGVETVPEYRRRGYGKAVVSAVTETLLSRDITPVYSCSVTNIASAKTAKSVGYQLYGEKLQWRYQPI